MKTKSLIFCIIALLLLSYNNNLHRRHENRSQENTAEISVSGKPVPAFQIKKGVKCAVRVVGITDGDTFKGLTADNQQVKCRIFGIDAPEKNQAFGQKSKQYLSELIFGKTVTIKIQGKSWDRAVVWAYTKEGKDISAEMLRAGMAWHYKKYSDDAEYAKLENQARRQKVGLWADKNAVAPWIFRKKQ
ncbi:MAG: thermonuclease family protein [Prevotellaceae bacterium]|jgi:endonuclease YncB( thermonuclease family)|nr:thermonuclease family protein [Prevotellaceae bacterium]